MLCDSPADENHRIVDDKCSRPGNGAAFKIKDANRLCGIPEQRSSAEVNLHAVRQSFRRAQSKRPGVYFDGATSRDEAAERLAAIAKFAQQTGGIDCSAKSSTAVVRAERQK